MIRSAHRDGLRAVASLRHVFVTAAPLTACLLAAIASMTASAPAHAQYRYKTASGETVFSDQPPPDSARQVATTRNVTAGASAQPRPELPYALRQVVKGNPVTLYTIANCAACDLARQHLSRRGIPYTERQVNSAEDVAAFTAAGFAENRYPGIGVGNARQLGYEQGAYDQMLDAAGYPSKSVLPPGWKAEAPTPLAGRRNDVAQNAVNAPAPGAVNTAPAASAAPTAPATPAPRNDAFRF